MPVFERDQGMVHLDQTRVGASYRGGPMTAIELDDLTVSEIMRRWPATMRLFIDRRLLCVGCPIAPFHALTDVAREHSVDHDDLCAAVLMIANGGDATIDPASTRRRSARAHADRTL